MLDKLEYKNAAFKEFLANVSRKRTSEVQSLENGLQVYLEG